MKIAIIGQKGIPAKSGGVERHVHDLAVRLKREGHEVIVYTRPSYTDKNLKEFEGVKLLSLPSVSTKNLDAISHTFFACLDLLKRRVDVIHFHSIGPSSLLWFVKIIKPLTPIVATFHCQDYNHKKWSLIARAYLKFGEFMCCYFADKVITVSKTLCEYAAGKYDIKPAYIPNGVGLQKQAAPEIITRQWGLSRDSYILYVGRLIQHKGVHYLLEAYKRLDTDKKLVIVGAGHFTDHYIQRLEEIAGNNPNIIFTGEQTGRALEELFFNSYYIVHPSAAEGLSISLLEAMAYGKAVLVSDIPENLEVVGESAYIFNNYNIEDLTTKMKIMLSDEVGVKTKARLGKEHITKTYNWDDLVKKVIAVYEDTIDLYKIEIMNSVIKKFILKRFVKRRSRV